MMNDKSILLVEDNPDDVELTRRAFRKFNLVNELLVAGDGAEAIALLATLEPLPQIVLLDLKLPRVDGLEVLRRIRENARTRLLPVVVLTSSREDQDLVRSYAMGANSYIRKPVDFKEFTEAVQQLGMYWLLLNEPPPRSVP